MYWLYHLFLKLIFGKRGSVPGLLYTNSTGKGWAKSLVMVFQTLPDFCNPLFTSAEGKF